MRALLSSVVRISQVTTRNDVIRNYARWAHRRPKKVLTQVEFEATHPERDSKEPNIIELNSKEVFKKFNQQKNKSKDYYETQRMDNAKHGFNFDEIDKKTHFVDENIEKKSKKEKKKEVKYVDNEILDTTFDKEGNLVYLKMKDNDARIGTLMLMVKSRKLRDRKNKVLLEGKRLIKDALEANCELDHLMFSRKNDLESFKHLLPKSGIKLYKMAYKDMQMWSDLTTCPGVMGIFKTPDVTNTQISENCLPLTIICDNIREPGNLGAILRAAVGVGCRNIILTKGCVDLWEPKVLRSASGAHFRLQIEKDITWENITNIIEKGSSVFLADNKIVTSDKTETEIKDLCLNVPLLPYFGVSFAPLKSINLIIGGETLGISEDAYKLAADRNGVRLNIPLDNDVDSLNTGTALGIIIFEIKRQILSQKM